MKKFIVGFAVVAAMAATGMAAAAESTEANDQLTTVDSGIVVGGDLGYSYTYGSNTVADSNFYPFALSSLSRGGFAWGFNAGYQINRYVAALLGYNNFSQVEADVAGTNGAVDTQLSNFTLSAKGIIPINAQFNLFGLLGAADMFQDFKFVNNGVTVSNTADDGSAWTAQLGLGVGYKVTPNVQLELKDIYDFKTSYKKNIGGTDYTVYIPA